MDEQDSLLGFGRLLPVCKASSADKVAGVQDDAGTVLCLKHRLCETK
jgi:hypothetical protein